MSRIDEVSRMLSDEDEAKIDLTPMLDVVFIMLIFFIVTATFVKELGLDGRGGALRIRAGCFGICKGGPIVAVMPDGTWYGRCTPEVIEPVRSPETASTPKKVPTMMGVVLVLWCCC